MHNARVLVVDDSAAMRAMFTNLLEESRNVEVVGVARDADEARELIEELHPNVLTLDVEMPGTNGIEFLREIMAEKPMPVVMLSSLTQKGADTSLQALEIGAIECFPKPLNVNLDDFGKTVAKLGKIVLAAANSNVRVKSTPSAAGAHVGDYAASGTIAAFSASMGGISALSEILARFPANCPPTVIALKAEADVTASFIARIDGEVPCSIRVAEDGAALVPGVVHITCGGDRHAVVEGGDSPVLRLLDKPPVDGARPSADLLFAGLARSGLPAVGAVLTGLGHDGAKGLVMLRKAGGRTMVQSRASAMVPEAPAAAIDADAAESELELAALSDAVLRACSRAREPA